MHVIPESWAHLHILVSLFPLVGLLFVLGFYVASIVTNNDGFKRICLLVVVGLGVLSIPIYISGMGSIMAVSAREGVSEDLINSHYNWSLYALLLLLLAAVAAGYEWMRSNNLGRFSNNALHLVLGISLITLLLMIAAGESGWEINHQELGLSTSVGLNLPSGSDIPEGQGTPQAWSHFHIILNHFPSIGLVIALFFFVVSLVMDNTGMKRASLVVFTMCGILGVPTYVTGASSMWALTDPPMENISQAAINAHRDMALWTLFALAATGVTAWIELWRFRYLGRFSSRTLYLVLGFAIVTLGLIAETGHRGGQINHPEIRTEALPTDPGAFPPKMAFIVIGGCAVLYFSLSDKLWDTKAGEEAPMTAKWVAAITLLAWAGVIAGGRLIPYV